MAQYLNSFAEYSTWNCLFANIIDQIPNRLFHQKFDVIILHYSFLANYRFLPDPKKWEHKIDKIANLQAKVKVALPQDEYLFFDRLYELFKSLQVDIIGTTLTKEHDIKKLYLKNKEFQPQVIKLLTGYFDQKLMRNLKNAPLPINQRNLDIVYRARKIEYFCGEHGDQKSRLADFFRSYCESKGLKSDIKNTDDLNSKKDNVLIGHDWYKFLMSSKAILGCEGGSSLLDVDGSIRGKILRYLKDFPNASFSEVKENCFNKEDYNIENFALGPRHLEAVLTKTVQVLIEGDYNAILVPWKHYLPLKKDFSNSEQILKYLDDSEFCQKMVDITYEELTQNKKLLYENLVGKLNNQIQNLIKRSESNNQNINHLTKFKLRNHPQLIKGEFRAIIKSILLKFFHPQRLTKILKLNRV